MPDRKKVIKGLEYCTLQARKGWPYEPEITKSGCEIYACPYIGNCGDMLFDALALLKEQSEIVRCKDCKHATMTIDGNLCKYCDLYKDDDGFLIELYGEADWFCANGERR